MNIYLLTLLSLIFLSPSLACKSRANNNPTLNVQTAENKARAAAIELARKEAEERAAREAEGKTDEEDETNSVAGDVDEVAEKITELEQKIANDSKLRAEERKKLEAEIVALKEQKKAAEDALSKKSAETSAAPVAGQRGPSGNPYCGSTYYGTIIMCGNYACAKADSAFVTTCEAHAQSKPALGVSGYPPCPGYFYGSGFYCPGGKVCGKSDPQLTKICQID